MAKAAAKKEIEVAFRKFRRGNGKQAVHKGARMTGLEGGYFLQWTDLATFRQPAYS